jgi:competence protein ComEA
MTVLQSLAIKILMLGITVGIIYWGVSADEQQQTRAPEPTILSDSVMPHQEEPRVKRDPPPETDPKVVADEEPSPGGDPVPPDGPKVGVAASPEPAPSTSVRRAKSFVTTPARRPVRFPIDLNKAPVHDLQELPGIGEKLAGRIVQHRKNHGSFKSIEDLRKVRGIGKKRMERLRPLVITTRAHD